MDEKKKLSVVNWCETHLTLLTAILSILLEKLGQQRIDNALEQTIRKCKRYHSAVRKADDTLDYALGLSMNKEQKAAVDNVALAYNHCGAEYGRAAYFQGLRDGIKLMSEIRRVLHRG